MKDYNEYEFIYPPRPEHKIKPTSLHLYDNGEYVAQPKYNGSCCVLFLYNGQMIALMNRHNEVITNVDKEKIDFNSCFRGTGWMVVCGELLNKSKKGEDGKTFNQKFILWEILVYCSRHLIGETTQYRLNLLEELYGSNRIAVSEFLETYEHLCTTSGAGIYKAPVYTKYFNSLYNEISQTDLYEGLVIKRLAAKLNYGFQERNNDDWQLKCRKATKNYSF